jgi:hypothetical protein
MTDNNQNIIQLVPNNEPRDKKPDEGGLVQIDAYVKITDPNTKETLVEIRE